MKKKTFLLLIV